MPLHGPSLDLVLRSLGLILLEHFFPQSWSLSGWGSFSKEMESYDAGVKELIVLTYERTLIETEPSFFSGFFEEQLLKVGIIINDYIRKLILSFILLPYINCLNTPDNRLPALRESDFVSTKGDTLPFGVYLQSGVSRIPYIYDFLFTLLVGVQSQTLLEGLPQEFIDCLEFFAGQTFLIISKQDETNPFPTSGIFDPLIGIQANGLVDPIFGIQTASKSELVKRYAERAQRAGFKIDTHSYRPGDGKSIITLFGEMEVLGNGQIITRCRR